MQHGLSLSLKGLSPRQYLPTVTSVPVLVQLTIHSDHLYRRFSAHSPVHARAGALVRDGLRFALTGAASYERIVVTHTLRVSTLTAYH